MVRWILIALVAPLLAACKHTPDPAGVAVERAIVRASEGESGIDVAAYALVINGGPENGIVAAECSCAESVELHQVERTGGSFRMTNIWPLALASKSVTEIAPGSSLHLMLMGIKAPIAPGQTQVLRFKLTDGRWIEAEFTAVSDSAQAWRELAGAPAQ